MAEKTGEPDNGCEKLKLSLIEELALSKKNLLDIDFDEEHLQDLLDYVCTL